VKRPRRWPSLDKRPGKFFCVFNGIGRESSTISCSPMAKRSIRTFTANNWTAWRQQSCRRGHLGSTEAELSSIRTTPGHSQLWRRPRSSGSSDGRFFCIHRIVRISQELITTCFCPWRTRLEDWSWPQESPVNREASFYKRGIIKLASHWDRVIEPNGAWLESHYWNLFY